MMETSKLNVCVLLILLCAAGMSSAASRVSQGGEALRTIRARYLTVNRNQAKYTKIKKDLSGFSTEGGELIAYLDGGSIVKIVANFYGETGKALEEYYYEDGQLIFVFRKDFRYSKPLYGRVVSSQAQRFYFDRGKMIRWLNEKGKAVSPGEEYSRKQEELLSSAKEFSDGARSQAQIIEATNP